MERESKENYLRIIIELEKEAEKGIKGARSVDIAKKLNITRASVSEMLRKLAKEKLISMQKYSKVSLTKQGKGIADKILKRNELIKEFMIKALKLNQQTAEDEAHSLEHSLSEDSIDRIKEIVESKEKQKQELEKELVYVG